MPLKRMQAVTGASSRAWHRTDAPDSLQLVMVTGAASKDLQNRGVCDGKGDAGKGGAKGNLQPVGATAAIDHIGAVVGEDLQFVVATAAEQAVVAVPAQKVIFAAAAGQQVIAGLAPQRIAESAAGQAVMARAAVDVDGLDSGEGGAVGKGQDGRGVGNRQGQVGGVDGIKAQPVKPLATIQMHHGGQGIGDKTVVAIAAVGVKAGRELRDVDQVISSAAIQAVGRIGPIVLERQRTEQLVIAVATMDAVIAACALQHVVASLTKDPVVTESAKQGIGARLA